jgi:leader peptidase (prepilin peptidase)/N-methyltransferase
MFAKSVVAVRRMFTCAELVPILRTTLDRRPLATRLDVMPPIAFSLLAAWCAVLSVIDIQQRRLPNVLTGWGALIVLGYALFTTQFTAAVVGAALLVVPYLLVHLAVPAAFGAGDVKLAVGLGATAALGGAQAWVWAAVAAPVLTAGAGLVVLSIRWIRAGEPDTARRRHTLPHGPAMCLATMVALAAHTG